MKSHNGIENDPENYNLESQGSNYGIKALHLLYGNMSTDLLLRGYHKSRSKIGKPKVYRLKTDNSKKRGRKALPKNSV
jgi:hypothetical protein